MKTPSLTYAGCAALFFFQTAPSQAALVGVLPATAGGTDYQAYYDTESDLTWLADANAAFGSEFDVNFDQPTGRLTWDQANAWLTSLNINGVTGWRFPTTPNPDPTCEYLEGPAFYNCSGSEMGNLYYNVLGGVAGGGEPFNANAELFSNIKTALGYWSTKTNSNYAWAFGFSSGWVTEACIDCAEGLRQNFVWAVHDGNAGAVPLPAAVYLFGSGFLGLSGIARRNKAA